MDTRAISIVYFNAPGSGMAKYAEYVSECYAQFNSNVQVHGYKINRNILVELIQAIIFKKGYVMAWVSNIIKNNCGTIIHFTDTPVFFFLILNYITLQKIHCIVTIHDPIPHLENTLVKNIKWLTLYLLNKYICYVSRHNAYIHIHIHSRKQGKYINATRVLYADHPISNESLKYSLITKYRSSEILHILYIGRIEHYKGVDLFYDSAKLLLSSMKNKVQFTIAGRGRLKKTSEHYNIKIINKYLSEEEFEGIVKRAHIVVLPYRNATQSGILSYSLARNKPVIASDKGLMSEYIINTKTGYVMTEASTDNLLEAYNQFVNNPTDIEKMSRAAREYKLKYSSKIISESYKKYLGKVFGIK